MASQHARTVQQHRVVQGGPFTLLDLVQFRGDVGQLFDEELVDLQPVSRVVVGQQVVDHVIDTQVRKPHRRVIVVELQRGDAGGVGLETKHHNVAHQPHVFIDILGQPILGTGNIRLRQCRSPTLELAILARPVDSLLDIPNRIEVLVQLATIAVADSSPQRARLGQHRIQHAAIGLLDGVLEHPVKRQGRIQFQGRGGRWRGP